jgi:hypothetical protein
MCVGTADFVNNIAIMVVVNINIWTQRNAKILSLLWTTYLHKRLVYARNINRHVKN